MAKQKYDQMQWDFDADGNYSGVKIDPSNAGLFGGIKDGFNNWKNKMFAPGTGDTLKGFYNKVTTPQFGWNNKTGVTGWGMNIGKGLNWANAGMQTLDAVQGLQNMSNSADAQDDIISDIITASYNSPTIQYDLNSQQMDLLRQLRRGTYDKDVGLDDVSIIDALSSGAQGALMGAPGGWVGALIGGIAGAANSVIDDLGGGYDENNAELEALYQAISESEQQYNLMKKQRAYAQLGMM